MISFVLWKEKQKQKIKNYKINEKHYKIKKTNIVKLSICNRHSKTPKLFSRFMFFL